MGGDITIVVVTGSGLAVTVVMACHRKVNLVANGNPERRSGAGCRKWEVVIVMHNEIWGLTCCVDVVEGVSGPFVPAGSFSNSI